MVNSNPEGQAFISYVREDAASVDWIQRTLEARGIRVWRDTQDLWPGDLEDQDPSGDHQQRAGLHRLLLGPERRAIKDLPKRRTSGRN
jgi:hypothetical protein